MSSNLIDLALPHQEAEIETRIAELRKEGFWSLKRLPKVPEPPRPKGHWDYLCEEMQWLSADFAQERRWKRGVARKVCPQLDLLLSILFSGLLFLDGQVGWKGTKHNGVQCL